MQDGYVELVKHVLSGNEVSPRGIRTREILNGSFILTDPTRAVPVGIGRKLGLQLGASEVAQLIAGVSDAIQVGNAAPNYRQFVENGRLYGAYGPRTHNQFSSVIKRLLSDRSSRQAGVVIWRPYDNNVPTKDVPCTLTLQYLLRDDKLHAITNMRSNDVFWGVPYDVWMFTAVQRTLAWAIGVDVGTYCHNAGSLHAYIDRDSAGFESLTEYDGKTQQPPPPFSLGNHLQVRSDQNPEARWIEIGKQLEGTLGLRKKWDSRSSSIQWFKEILVGTLSGGLLCTSCRYVLPRTEEYFKPSRLARSQDNNGTTCICYACERAKPYGIGGHKFEALRLIQNDKCAICGSSGDGRWGNIVIDHDHATEKVRGLLCSACNGTLAYCRDNPERLTAAAEYLKNPPYSVLDSI